MLPDDRCGSKVGHTVKASGVSRRGHQALKRAAFRRAGGHPRYTSGAAALRGAPPNLGYPKPGLRRLAEGGAPKGVRFGKRGSLNARFALPATQIAFPVRAIRRSFPPKRLAQFGVEFDRKAKILTLVVRVGRKLPAGPGTAPPLLG